MPLHHADYRPPLSDYSAIYEPHEDKYWLKFSPEPLPPKWIEDELRKFGWFYDAKRQTWNGRRVTWDAVRALLKGIKELTNAPGQVRTPGRREMKAAKDELRRQAGPGKVVALEDVQKVAKAIMDERGRVAEKVGFVAAGDVAPQVVAKAIKDKELANQNAVALADFNWGETFEAWAEANLWVKDKETFTLIPFKLNDAQRELVAFMWKQWKEEGWVRVLIVKSRQIGFSTVVQALYFYICVSVPNVECLVMADAVDTADAVFRRTRNFEKYCPVKPAGLGRDNKRELAWDAPHSSAMRVFVADNPNVGIGDTRQLAHFSEAAFYGDKGPEIMSSVLPSIPDAPGTMIVYESTANGQAGFFYDTWTQANEKIGRVRNFFSGILDDPTVRLKDPPPEDDHEAWKSIPMEWKEDEDRLRSIGGDWPLLAWRRYAIAEKCKGDPKMFLARYPATAKEAFVATGAHSFPVSIIDPELERTSRIERDRPAPRYRLNASRDKFVEDKFGPLRIWKQPEDGHPYLISVDTAVGESVSGKESDTAKLDYTCFRVVDRWPDKDGVYEEVAVWHGRMDSDLAAYEVCALAKMYNDALVAPEVNHSSGLILVARLARDLRYNRIYVHEAIDKPTRDPVQQDPDTHIRRLGFRSGPHGGIAKGVMIETLNEFIRERKYKIHEPEGWGELRTMMRSANGTHDAMRGCHDDRVTCMAVNAVLLRLHPLTPPVERASKAAPMFSGPWFQQKLDARKKARAGSGGDYD